MVNAEAVPRKESAHALRIACLTFVFFTTLTVFFYFLARQNLLRLETLEFSKEAEKTLSLIRGRIDIYENALRGAQALYAASERVERDEWQAYARQVDLQGHYPGIANLRLIERVKAADREAFLRDVRGQNMLDFSIHPPGGRGEYFVTKYIYPEAGYEDQLGYDVSDSPARRRALERAVDTGDIAVTERTDIIKGSEKSPGFIFYLPLYKPDAPVSTTEERRLALTGFVSATFRTSELFAGILEDITTHPGIDFEIFFGGRLSKGNFLYASRTAPNMLGPARQPRFFLKRDIPVADGTWRVYFTADAILAPTTPEKRLPPIHLLAGIFASFVAAIMVFGGLKGLSRRAELLRTRAELAQEREKRVRKELEETRRKEEDARKTSEELELKVMERTAELEAFSYSVSHDLRSPLIAINGFTSAVLEDYGARLDGEARDYLRKVASNSKNMGLLIDDLLAFSKLGRQSMTFSDQINMGALAHEVFEELRKGISDRAVEFRLKDLPMIKGDRAMMRQVWQNLLSNAVKYTRGRPKAVIEAGCAKKDGETIFYVKDNGAGFDMAYRHKLFQVFQRLHSRDQFEGTGVGLAIVQRVVSRHGGHVWAEGKEGEGATFYFAIPEAPYFRERDEAWLTSMKSRS